MTIDDRGEFSAEQRDLGVMLLTKLSQIVAAIMKTASGWFLAVCIISRLALAQERMRPPKFAKATIWLLCCVHLVTWHRPTSLMRRR